MKDGIYELLIDHQLAGYLETVPEKNQQRKNADSADLSQIVTDHLSQLVRQKLQEIQDASGKDKVIEKANEIIQLLNIDEKNDLKQIDPHGEQLMALRQHEDLLTKEEPLNAIRPETSIIQSSLFTGSGPEPALNSEFRREIASCNRIDLLVSFIRWSGLDLILDALKEFLLRGGQLRVITTCYMGATEFKAIETLAGLPNTQIKISYDTERTRLHAKAYIYKRETGFDTAYIGSSNLTKPAISSGLEWNMKITRHDQPDVFKKVEATFDAYWHNPEFEIYNSSEKKKLIEALDLAKGGGGESLNIETYILDARPYPYQQQILDQLQAERQIHHSWRNLVVAATGTGKTVIAAFDYRNFVADHPDQKNRLLFVAHRQEILKQALRTFRSVLKDANFGELYVGNYRPNSYDHLFVSVQTLNVSQFLMQLPPDFYDFVVLDECHHSTAFSYERFLNQIQPKVLLGLTATPERMDGQSILEFFNQRIAAEIRLPDAIDQKLLVPFHYFGISDPVDLDTLTWTRNGYDINELSERYISNKERTRIILESLNRYARDLHEIKGLGFCVSIEHAKYMAEMFNQAGIPSIMLSGSSLEEERNRARDRLVAGDITFIFVVDLYNEGVDIPEVNTILFLRPTQSLTIFLQQLGRGLRLADNKDCLTVLDFIGAANKKYDFTGKFGSLLTRNTCNLPQEMAEDFHHVPKGCSILLEKVASEHILKNIKENVLNLKEVRKRMASFEKDTQLPLNLRNFLKYYEIQPSAFYKMKASFYELAQEMEKNTSLTQMDPSLKKSLVKLAKVDSANWIQFMKQLLQQKDPIVPENLKPRQKRMLDMLYVTLFKKTMAQSTSAEIEENLKKMQQDSLWQKESGELLDLQYDQIDLVETPSENHKVPLDLYKTYTRDQLFTALNFATPGNIREGVKWLEKDQTDVLLVTLNKSDKDYSPTTLYNDYSISDSLFHWQSQSTTSETSVTGQRYIHHDEQGSKVLLFVRENKYDKVSGDAEAYTYLGPVHYVSHEGSKPMNVIWRMENKIPAKYLAASSKLI